ncbi:FAD binding domain-containing protein [Colletotrichum somersetense]|nr:FAD binding domain-containing protein [Colletotrichum somersetense]
MNVRKPFKVVVVGGGVAGLTLANMFQRLDIDFVVLEGHGDIAPPVGASIGLFPSGLRILDQIGCYEPILAMELETLHWRRYRDSSGNAIASVAHWDEHIVKRHGYPILFFDRQWLLQVLYEQVQDKSCILIGKKVNRIDHNAGGVQVTTSDGETFDGSIVVGADGIHSSVRKELNRIAHEAHSFNAFPPNQEDEIPCYYKCSFGIAQNVSGWARHEQSVSFGKGSSALIVSGPENRVYWFIFVRLPEVKHGKSSPKYTKKDDEAFAKEYAGMQITETITFGDIYEKKLTSTLTPLHEMVYKTWFHKRVVLLGDAVHKPNPITGQGGNGAIETAAELINALVEARDVHHGLENLSDDDVSRIFARMQSVREKRAHWLVNDSHDHQSLMATESPLKTDIMVKTLSVIPAASSILPRMSGVLLPSSKINRLPVPHRPRAIPFNDELPTAPAKPETSNLIRNVYAGGMLASVVLAAVTIPARAAPGGIQCLWQHVAPILMYTIEGNRVGNRSVILGAPTLVGIGLHGLGINRVIPSHALLHAFSSFEAPPERYVPAPVAKSILVTFTLSGFVAAAKYLLDKHQGVPTDLGSSIWKLSALFPTLVWGLSKVLKSGKSKQPVDGALDRYETFDVPYLRATYLCAFGVQAAAHVASSAPFVIGQTLLGALTDAVASPSAVLSSLPSGAKLAYAAWVLQNFYSIWDIRRLGYISSLSALKAAVGVVLGQVLVGPGATWAGLWYWREEIFASNMVR